MNIEEKLDSILNFLKEKEHYNLEFDKKNELWGELANRVAGGNNKLFLMLLNKLEDDSYVDSKIFGNGYVITVNGLLHINKNGYTQILKNSIFHAEKIEIESTIKSRNELLIIGGTWLAGIGSIAIVIIEIIKALNKP